MSWQLVASYPTVNSTDIFSVLMWIKVGQGPSVPSVGEGGDVWIF